jgi:ABC-type branched-subunit amino acid transport system ATPase component
MLDVQRIDAFYGDSHILHGVDLKIRDGQRVAVLGRNGAGKSTLLKSIMNAEPTVKGTITWNGEVLGSKPSYVRAKLGLCLVPEDRRIFSHLTVLENLTMARYARPSGAKPLEAEEVLGYFPMLVPLAARYGSQLSGGQQQLVAFARALMARPKLMLLDEPTEGLAPIIVEQLAKDVLNACVREGVGLLLCEQNIWFARQCTEEVAVIDSGQIVYAGTWQEFDERSDIKNRYLAM